jgi:hypothetical protein
MVDKLKEGRESYQRRAWGDAYQSLSLTDQATPLGVEDLELLATSSYLTGRDLDFHRFLDRAHHAGNVTPIPEGCCLPAVASACGD